MIQEIRCERTHMLLARKNKEGMFLYCKGCKQERFYTWEELQKETDYATENKTGTTTQTRTSTDPREAPSPGAQTHSF